MKKILLRTFLLAGALILSGASTHASTITFTNFVEFNGSVIANVVATIEDTGTNTVKITMDATNLSGSGKITDWYFNVSQPGLTASEFLITKAASPNDAVTVSYDSLRAGGDGYFDIDFTFHNSGNTFVAGEKSEWTVTHIGLDASDFMGFSMPGPGPGNPGPYYSALKFEDFFGSKTDPGPATAPEPATMFLLGSGLLGLAGYVRRKFKK